MRPFGYRNRLNRYFEIFNNRGNKRAHFELALWLKENYRQKNPRAPQPIAVRFLQINRNLKMNGFKKHWENEPIEKFNPEQYYVLYISSYLTPPKS